MGDASQNGPRTFQFVLSAPLSRMKAPFFVPKRTMTRCAIIDSLSERVQHAPMRLLFASLAIRTYVQYRYSIVRLSNRGTIFHRTISCQASHIALPMWHNISEVR